MSFQPLHSGVEEAAPPPPTLLLLWVAPSPRALTLSTAIVPESDPRYKHFRPDAWCVRTRGRVTPCFSINGRSRSAGNAWSLLYMSAHSGMAAHSPSALTPSACFPYECCPSSCNSLDCSSAGSAANAACVSANRVPPPPPGGGASVAKRTVAKLGAAKCALSVCQSNPKVLNVFLEYSLTPSEKY